MGGGGSSCPASTERTGGKVAPIGSASTLVAVTVMHRHNVPLSFGGFVVQALPYALLRLAIAVLYVLFVVPFLA